MFVSSSSQFADPWRSQLLEECLVQTEFQGFLPSIGVTRTSVDIPASVGFIIERYLAKFGEKKRETSATIFFHNPSFSPPKTDQYLA